MKVLMNGITAVLLVCTAVSTICAGQTMAARTASQGSKGGGSADVSSNRPVTAPPQVDRFEVGPADVLRISVWKEPELSQVVTIRPDGCISLPLVHDISVRGKTTSEIEVQLASLLQSFIVNPQVSVNLVEIHTKLAYITGEVGKPGGYPLTGPIDVLQLIAKAGGLTQYAKRKQILLIRTDSKGQHRYILNYQDFVKGTADPKAYSLQAGDTVVVP